MFITATKDMRLETPWMASISDSSLPPEINPFFATDVNEGDRYVYAPEQELLAIHRSWGGVHSVIGTTNLQANPAEEELAVFWFGRQAADGSSAGLTFEGGEVYPENLEGHVPELFGQFVELATNKIINPAGLFLKDGFYPCRTLDIGEGFNISFGQSGRLPAFELVSDEPVEEDKFNLPWKMVIRVNSRFHFPHYQNREGDDVQPGEYVAEIRGWHRETNNVTALRIEGASAFDRYHLDEEEFFRQAQSGNIEVVEVIIDQRQRF